MIGLDIGGLMALLEKRRRDTSPVLAGGSDPRVFTELGSSVRSRPLALVRDGVSDPLDVAPDLPQDPTRSLVAPSGSVSRPPHPTLVGGSYAYEPAPTMAPLPGAPRHSLPEERASLGRGALLGGLTGLLLGQGLRGAAAGAGGFAQGFGQGADRADAIRRQQWGDQIHQQLQDFSHQRQGWADKTALTDRQMRADGMQNANALRTYQTDMAAYEQAMNRFQREAQAKADRASREAVVGNTLAEQRRQFDTAQPHKIKQIQSQNHYRAAMADFLGTRAADIAADNNHIKKKDAADRRLAKQRLANELERIALAERSRKDRLQLGTQSNQIQARRAATERGKKLTWADVQKSLADIAARASVLESPVRVDFDEVDKKGGFSRKGTRYDPAPSEKVAAALALRDAIIAKAAEWGYMVEFQNGRPIYTKAGRRPSGGYLDGGAGKR